MVGGSITSTIEPLPHSFTKDEHPINLFMWTLPGAADQPEQQFSHQGYNVIEWSSSGMCYWAVSDVNNTDLHEFVQLIRQ